MDTQQSTTNSELIRLKIIPVQTAVHVILMRNSIQIQIHRSVI